MSTEAVNDRTGMSRLIPAQNNNLFNRLMFTPMQGKEEKLSDAQVNLLSKEITKISAIGDKDFSDFSKNASALSLLQIALKQAKENKNKSLVRRLINNAKIEFQLGKSDYSKRLLGQLTECGCEAGLNAYDEIIPRLEELYKKLK
jgi:hypothetical protein